MTPPAPESRPRHRRRVVGTGLKVGVAGLAVGTAAFLLVLKVVGGADDKGESLTAATARAGQCVDVATAQGRVDITEADCDGAHDAEIVLTSTVGDAIEAGVELDDPETACRGLLDDADADRLDEQDPDLDWGLLIDEPSNVDPFDRLVCYVRAADGRLAEPLLG